MPSNVPAGQAKGRATHDDTHGIARREGSKVKAMSRVKFCLYKQCQVSFRLHPLRDAEAWTGDGAQQAVTMKAQGVAHGSSRGCAAAGGATTNEDACAPRGRGSRVCHKSPRSARQAMQRHPRHAVHVLRGTSANTSAPNPGPEKNNKET